MSISGGEKILIVPAALFILYLFSWYRKASLWKYFFAALLLVIPFIHFHIQWLTWMAPFAAIYIVRKAGSAWLILFGTVAAFVVPFLYNDKFMSVSLFTPISQWFSLIPGPFAVVQRLADPYLVQSVFHSIFVGCSLALIWQMFGGYNNEKD